MGSLHTFIAAPSSPPFRLVWTSQGKLQEVEERKASLSHNTPIALAAFMLFRAGELFARSLHTPSNPPITIGLHRAVVLLDNTLPTTVPLAVVLRSFFHSYFHAARPVLFITLRSYRFPSSRCWPLERVLLLRYPSQTRPAEKRCPASPSVGCRAAS